MATDSENTVPDALARKAEAVADGTWDGNEGSQEADAAEAAALRVIAGVAGAHRRAALGQGSEGAHESLGEVLSRAAGPVHEAPDLSSARRWGQLYILERVGGGAFGEVFRAWDPALAREVALKILRFPEVDRRAGVVVREGQLLASVRHENVISVYGAAQMEDEVGIWMEFVRGRTLEQIVREDGPMSASEATIVAEALCGALSAMHGAGLLHRDIKAANIMRATGGRIVLLDFGTGVEMGGEDAGGRRLAGTPLYMAPELFEGAPPSVRSDIYSLGVLLFFLVSGTYPVYARTLHDVRSEHRAGRRLLLEDVRPGLAALFAAAVDGATDPDPACRPRSVAGLRIALLRQVTPPRSTGFGPWVGLAFASIAGVWLVGLWTSLLFNLTVGRDSGLALDSMLSYWILGLRALLLPGVFVVVFAAAVSFAGLLYRLLGPIRWVEALPGNLAKRRRVGPGEWLLLLQVVVLAGLCLILGDLLVAAMTRLADAPVEVLRPLRPDVRAPRLLHVFAFSMATALFAWLWTVVRRRVPTGGTRRAHVVGMLVTLATFLVLILPYRIAWQNRRERVLWGSAICYAVDVMPEELLLYCPQLSVPRVRLVPASDASLRKSGHFESMFTVTTVRGAE